MRTSGLTVGEMAGIMIKALLTMVLLLAFLATDLLPKVGKLSAVHQRRRGIR
jgi:hypothetical protein